MQQTHENAKWDTDYEWKILVLLTLGFGLVGLDRWIIAPLFPFMQADLGLTDGDIGTLSGILGVVWGVFAIICGSLADKVGHRKILIPALFIFSLMSGLSGMAHTMMGLVIIRGVMGAMEGAYAPTGVIAIGAASKPSRRGLNQGVQQCGFALFGLALGPIIATQLLAVVPSWREVFWVVAIPGVIVGILMWKVLREPKDTMGGHLIGAVETGAEINWMSIFKSHNIKVAMVALFCTMTAVFILSAMVPVYLINAMGVSPGEMGFVTSALGWGGFLGQASWPGVSDRIGRKTAAIIGFVFSSVGVWWFANTGGDNVTILFASLFMAGYFALGTVSVLTGPISTEAAPIGLVGAAVGLVVGIGEIFGGGVMPAVAGYFADNYGLPSVMHLALGGVVLGIFVSLFLKETAPIKVGGEVTTSYSGPEA